MQDTNFHIGIVGYGIVQRTPKKGSSAPDDYPELQHYTDIKQLLADAVVDVVIITTPPDCHFEHVKASLEAGKHVLIEKPFVPTSALANELIRIANENKRLLCVYQNRRWDADFLLIKHLISNDTLGRIYEFNTHFDRYRAMAPSSGWQAGVGIPAGGSVLYGAGTHTIDQVYMLFGMPQSVRARLSSRTGQPDLFSPEIVSAELAYPDKLVHVRVNMVSTETPQLRFWIRGTKGSLRKLGLDPQEDQLIGGMRPTEPGYGYDSPENMQLTLVGDDEKTLSIGEVPKLEPPTYMAFYHALAAAIRSGNPVDLPVQATEARDVLRIIEAIIESAKSGIDISFI